MWKKIVYSCGLVFFCHLTRINISVKFHVYFFLKFVIMNCMWVVNFASLINWKAPNKEIKKKLLNQSILIPILTYVYCIYVLLLHHRWIIVSPILIYFAILCAYIFLMSRYISVADTIKSVTQMKWWYYIQSMV